MAKNKKSGILILGILVFFLSGSMYAQDTEKKRIAVIPFKHGGGITKEEALYLTDKVRNALIASKAYDVISNDQIETMMQVEAQKQGVGSGSCSSEKCMIDLGNALESEKMLVGSASGAFGEYSISAKILDVVTQQYEEAADLSIADKSEFPQAAKELVSKITGVTINVETSENSDKLVNRRVLILDFQNSQNNKDFSYLEGSVPDAFLEPLDKTKSFELLKRNLWQKMVEKKEFMGKDAYDEDTALKAARKAGADVVVIGSFTVMNDEMQLYSKALEVSSERVIVNRNKRSKLDSNMFTSIDELAVEMSKEMKDKLPPLPQKVLVEERIKYVNSAEVSYSGFILRSLALPGWGHIFANKRRGFFYAGVFIGLLGSTGYYWYDSSVKKDDYYTANDNLQKKYDDYNLSHKIRGYSIVGLASLYLVVLSDGLITGDFKKSDYLHKYSTKTSGNIFVVPEF
ncbi:MAG: hypothetical protein OEZ13_11735, partial [Spirochaetia bacterium]|nr:hypothetical protein [Spirochaetia bacterium]